MVCTVSSFVRNSQPRSLLEKLPPTKPTSVPNLVEAVIPLYNYTNNTNTSYITKENELHSIYPTETPTAIASNFTYENETSSGGSSGSDSDNRDNTSPKPINPPPVPLPLPLPSPSKVIHDQTESTVTFTASDARIYDHFGHAMATDGKTVFISTYTWGKPNTVCVEDIDTSANSSTIISDSLMQNWFESAKLPVLGSIPMNEFGAGISAAVNGSLILGSPYDSSLTRNGGSVTVYKQGPVAFRPIQTIASKTPTPFAFFGFGVATNEELLVVSAPGEKNSNKISGYSGRVYVYSYSSTMKK